METPILYYIRGVKGRGEEVIKMLEDKGAFNDCFFPEHGDDPDQLYFIDDENCIEHCSCYDQVWYRLIRYYGVELELRRV